MDAACQSNPKCCWKIPKLEISLTRTPTKSSKYPIQNYMELLFCGCILPCWNLGAPNFAPKSGEIELHHKCLFPITNLAEWFLDVSGTCFWYAFWKSLKCVDLPWWNLIKGHGTRLELVFHWPSMAQRMKSTRNMSMTCGGQVVKIVKSAATRRFSCQPWIFLNPVFGCLIGGIP